MHQSMMISAELHQIVDAGFTARGPVLDVVAIEVILMGAAGKAAAFVPGFQYPSHGGGDDPELSPDIDEFAGFVFEKFNHTAVTSDAPGCFRGNNGLRIAPRSA